MTSRLRSPPESAGWPTPKVHILSAPTRLCCFCTLSELGWGPTVVLPVARSGRFGLTSLTSPASCWTEADEGGLGGLVLSWCHMAIKYWSTWPGGPISAHCAILHNGSRGLPPREQPWKVGSRGGGMFTGHRQQYPLQLLKDQKSLPAREVVLGWAGLAGTSSQASLQGAHGSSTPSGGHTGKTGSVWRSPGRGSSPSPLTAQASQDHLPPETLSASELGGLRWSWNLCGPQFQSQLYREQVP